MLDIIQNIGTPISLFALIITLLAYVILSHQKNKFSMLKTLPESERWKALNKDLENYNITEDNLSKEQKFKLMQTVIENKNKKITRIIYVFFFMFIITSILISLNYLHKEPKKLASIPLSIIFGKTIENKERVQLIPKSENIIKLNKSFDNSKSKIRIVTELGNTWLLSENYQSIISALNRKIDVEILTFDFTNQELRQLARYSSQKGEGKGGYTPDEVLRGFKDYKNLLVKYPNLTIYPYREYPWVRFTLFDDSAVSFVLRPMLNISKPKPFFSTDPLIIKMFEAIYKNFKNSSEVTCSTSKEYEKYINQYKLSVQ